MVAHHIKNPEAYQGNYSSFYDLFFDFKWFQLVFSGMKTTWRISEAEIQPAALPGYIFKIEVLFNKITVVAIVTIFCDHSNRSILHTHIIFFKQINYSRARPIPGNIVLLSNL